MPHARRLRLMNDRKVVGGHFDDSVKLESDSVNGPPFRVGARRPGGASGAWAASGRPAYRASPSSGALGHRAAHRDGRRGPRGAPGAKHRRGRDPRRRRVLPLPPRRRWRRSGSATRMIWSRGPGACGLDRARGGEGRERRSQRATLAPAEGWRSLVVRWSFTSAEASGDGGRVACSWRRVRGMSRGASHRAPA